MFRSTFIKKISISWLSQHNSNNFTSSKFLFIYIFANSSSLPTFQRSLKIFQHFQNIFIKTVNSLRNLQTEKFPISLSATVSIVSFHFNFLYFFSPYLQNSFNSLIHPPLHEERCSSSSSIVPPFIPRIEEERFRYRRAPNSKTRSIVGQFTITGVILPRHQASISSIAAQTHTHAHTHPRRWSTRYRSRGKRSQPIGDDRSGSIFRLDRGRGGEWRERSLLGRLIRWSFDTWRGACISAVWSASPPRYALLALFSQGCRWVFFSPSEPGRGGSVSRGIWKRENFWSGWKKRCNYFFW